MKLRILLPLLIGSLAAVPASAQSPTTLAHAFVERLPPVSSPQEPEDGPRLAAPERIPAPSSEVPIDSTDSQENAEVLLEPRGLPGSAAPKWYSPMTDWFLQTEDDKGKKIWQRSVELGIDGSDGNSNTFNIRFGLDLKRQTETHKFKLDLDYYKADSNGTETANQTFLDCRYERQLMRSRLNWFLNGNVDHDEFKLYDFRITLNTGTGYRLIERDKSTLTFRFGAGASHEVGGPDEVYVPELVYGVELDHQISDRQKISFQCDYFPDITDFRKYRIDSKASWEVLLDKETNLSLKLSLHDRYDADAYEITPNDLDYSAVLLWKF